MRTALVTTAVLLSAAVPAMAAWDPPARASRGPMAAHSPAVAMNGAGAGVAAWVRGTGRDAAIVVSVQQAGQAWGEPVAISRKGRPAIDPTVTVDGRGQVAVVWRQVVRTRRVVTESGPRRQAVYVVRARVLGAGATRWGRIATLSSDRQKVGVPEAGVDATGTVVATWHWGTGTSPADPAFVGIVQYAQLGARGGWTSPRRLSRASRCREVRLPRVAVGASGHTVIWWQCDLAGGRSTALSVSRVPGGSLGPETELPFRQSGGVEADLAVSPAGRAVAVSAGSDGTLSWWRGDVDGALELAGIPALSSNERIDADAGPPQIAVGATGDALSAWTDLLGRARATPIAADLGVGAPVSLDMAGRTSGGVAVAVGDARQGTVAWFRDGRISASQRSTTGELGPATTISGPGVDPADPPVAASDATGDTAVYWTRDVGGRTVVERAVTTSP